MPTGAVIERGSNANGEYLRFADGTQICTHSFDAGDTMAIGAGTFADPYRSAGLTWDFPAVFADVPAGFSAICRTDANAQARIQYLVGRYLTAAQASQMQVVRGSSSNTDSATAPTTVHLTAAGRWI